MNTPSQKSLKVSTFALACAMSATLILGGCGDKDKPKNTEIAKIENIKARKIDNAEAVQALTALYLNQSDSDIISWTKRDGDSGNYIYSDVVVNGEKGADIKLGQIEIWGAHMEDDQANYDKIEFRDYSYIHTRDDKNFSIERFSLVKPSANLAFGVIQALGGDKEPFEDIEGDISFQAMSFANMQTSGDDSTLSIKSLSMGETKDKTGVFSLAGLELDAQDDDGGNVKMSLDAFEVTGANLDKYKNLMAEPMQGEDENALANIMGSMNVYDPDFTSVNLSGLDINADGLLVTLKSYEANANKKNGVVTMSQKMSPLSITPPENGEVLGQKGLSNMLSTMGYDQFEFTMGGKSILDEKEDTLKTQDTYIEMRDGFRLGYDVDISGYKAFTEQAVKAQEGGALKNPIAAIGMANSVQLNKIRFSLRDDSILDRYFKMSAEQNNTTPEALKKEIKDSLARISMEAQDEAQQKLADELKSSVTSFIDGGGTLVFEMNPNAPVNPGGVAMGAMLGSLPDFSELNITVSTE